MPKHIGSTINLMNQKNNTFQIHSDINIIISDKEGKPFLELNKRTFDNELIKKIIMAAFVQQPLVIQPVFTNRIRSINTLINKGIIYQENDNLYFTF